jgi:hypothetical protein
MIYTKEYLLETEAEINGAKALFFEFGELRFCILKYEMIKGLIALPFYAMSRGFELFTNTGYKSNFASIGEKVSSEDIRAFIKAEIKESGLDLDNQKPMLLGSVGGVTTLVQPSLF